jgi:NAD(P)-dependent dehydrogenase (short-subunit alcohol dehydrogenase family)
VHAVAGHALSRYVPRVDDKVAIVTGASRGIGKQTCLQLATKGIHVVLAARTEEPRPNTPGTLAETAAEVRALGVEPLTVTADLSVAADVDRVLAAALDRFGHVDILVNNAAYTVGKTLWTLVPDLTRDQWDKNFAVNVTAPLMLIQGVWESMRARGGGVIVNITSGAANLQPVSADRANTTGLPENGPAYGASKAALNRMANVIAQEGLPHRIAVITMEPGLVLTETMAATFERSGVTNTSAISTSVPASVIAYLATCDDPMRYTGELLSAPELAAQLGLA